MSTNIQFPTVKKIVDACVFIDHYRNKLRIDTKFSALLKENTQIFISTITEYELLAGITPNSDSYWNVEIAKCVILPFDSRCARVASKIQAMLRKRGQKIDLPDILVAATAHVHGLEIVTLNKRHFEIIDECLSFL